ncbi:MAG: hypothetical protein LBG43_11530 [Treponema sp.]|nr:hypothetical protein [Treponema sp.]
MKSLRKNSCCCLSDLVSLYIQLSSGAGLLMYRAYLAYIQTACRKTISQVTDMLIRAYPQLRNLEYLTREGVAGTAEYWRLARFAHRQYVSILPRSDGGGITKKRVSITFTNQRGESPQSSYDCQFYATAGLLAVRSDSGHGAVYKSAGKLPLQIWKPKERAAG